MNLYGVKGKALLEELKRAEWLPPYDESGVKQVTDEIATIHDQQLKLYAEHDISRDSVKASHFFYNQCFNRNRRYINCYFNHRLTRIRELRWETGPVIPDRINQETLSQKEREYFMAYSKLLGDYNRDIDLDLFVDLEPPKDLLIEIRVLHGVGTIQTESGPVNLEKGSIHFLRRVDVEQLIRDGQVEHVLNNDHQG